MAALSLTMLQQVASFAAQAGEEATVEPFSGSCCRSGTRSFCPGSLTRTGCMSPPESPRFWEKEMVCLLNTSIFCCKGTLLAFKVQGLKVKCHAKVLDSPAQCTQKTIQPKISVMSALRNTALKNAVTGLQGIYAHLLLQDDLQLLTRLLHHFILTLVYKCFSFSPSSPHFIKV